MVSWRVHTYIQIYTQLNSTVIVTFNFFTCLETLSKTNYRHFYHFCFDIVRRAKKEYNNSQTKTGRCILTLHLMGCFLPLSLMGLAGFWVCTLFLFVKKNRKNIKNMHCFDFFLSGSLVDMGIFANFNLVLMGGGYMCP